MLVHCAVKPRRPPIAAVVKAWRHLRLQKKMPRRIPKFVAHSEQEVSPPPAVVAAAVVEVDVGVGVDDDAVVVALLLL